MTSQYGVAFGPARRPGEGSNSAIVFWQDFITAYTGASGTASGEADPTGTFSPIRDRGEWHLSADAGGVDPAPVTSDGLGGVVAWTTASSAGARSQIQVNGTSFAMDLHRPCLWQARVKFSTTTQSAFLGLSTTNEDAYSNPSEDGVVGFQLAGDANLSTYMDKTGGDAPAAVDANIAIVAGEWVELSLAFDGQHTLRFFANDEKVGMFNSRSTNVPLGVLMSPVICLESNGAAETISVDYCYAACNRG